MASAITIAAGDESGKFKGNSTSGGDAGMDAAPARRLGTPSDALSFVKSVHLAQKRTGLWLPKHPFVQAVHAGLASRDELGQWVRQVYCITRAYATILLSLNPPPPVGVWLDPWRDLELLVDLGRALGISSRDLRSSAPCLAARGIQVWMHHHLANPSLHVGAQACWALVEAMSPEAAVNLADGAEQHLGLKPRQLRYFRGAMKARQDGDRYAASLLSQMPQTNWPAIYFKTLLVSGLVADLYGSIRDGGSHVHPESPRGESRPYNRSRPGALRSH